VRIPLDYYRILGLPIQTSVEQLQQAYHDRIRQLPRREYSEAAIEARKQLIEKAYTVLSDPEQRDRYDASYFAHTYEPDAETTAESTVENQPNLSPATFDPHTPSIEISDELFVGALLILQELGEYELVLNLGHPYLSGQLDEPDMVRSDIILTIALACLELGREQWQQGQYESAATSLEAGQNFLSCEGLFPSVADEIQTDLYKLRPYRILGLLARPEADVAERRTGLQLLQDILQERHGIDGTNDDGSGLSVEDFLRFIQQIRGYLTAAEQQSLFEVESQRPSAVATFLAVYALIARGFTQRLPVLIRQAKLMLKRLGKRQDLHLEQAICSLLLGQTTEASRALELSQEYEPLAFIREHSQGSSDLLPGLCLYSERWLQTEVFPHFRDLAQQQASLKEYFADEQVQTYLEALPTQSEATNEWETGSPQPNYETQANIPQGSDPALASHAHSTSVRQRRNRDTSRQTAKIASRESSERSPLAASVSSVAVLPPAERITRPNSSTSALTQIQSPQRSNRRTRSRVARGSGSGDNGVTLFHRQGSSSALAVRNGLEARKTRLVLLLLGSVLSIAILWFLASQVYGFFRQVFFPAPSLPREQLLVQLNQPPLPIPKPNSKPAAAEPLNQVTAAQVIQSWLSTKSAAFGSKHEVDRLEQILVEPALSQWQRRAQNDKANKRYRQYKHNIKVNSVQRASANERAQVEATVNEVAQVYENGKLNQNSSYGEDVRVRYSLVRKDGQWRIQEMKVLK